MSRCTSSVLSTHFDIVVPRSRLQLDPDVLSKAKKSLGSSQNGLTFGSTALRGNPVNAETKLKAGQRVLIEWRGSWWGGHIIKTMKDGKAEIHYDGHSDDWDEIVPRSRLRMLPPN